MQQRIVHRAVAWAAAGLSLLCFLGRATPASAALLEGYKAGSGASRSYLVVDFGFTAGDAFVFEYRYDGETTGEAMLLALDDAGALDVALQRFSFGVFVDGFRFAGRDHRPGFEGPGGENWSYWLDGGSQDVLDFNTGLTLREAVAAGQYAASQVGPTDRILADGSVDGWVANVSAFNSRGLPASDNAPASLPEPAALLALFGVAALATRRRGAS